MIKLINKFVLVACIAVMCGTALSAQTKYKQILWEDFSKFTAGSEEKPTSSPVNDSFQSIPWDKTLTPGWQGVAIYQAGGMAYQGEGGRIFTPNIDLSQNGGTFRVTFKMKLAPDSPAAYANIVHQNISSYRGPDLTTDWQTVTVEMSGGMADDYLAIRALGSTSTTQNKARVFIDDILVEVPDPELPSPTSVMYGNFDGSSFTAAWRRVQGAQSYELRVYTLSSNGQPDYIEGDFTTTDLSFDITGLEEKWHDYYLQVRALADNLSSPWSTPLLVEGLPTPVVNDEITKNDNSFTASWTSVGGTYNYEINTYYIHKAKGDEQFYHINTGFDFVKQQELPGGQFDAGFNELPGWFFGCADLQDGYIGVQGAMAFLGYAAQIESPALNLASSGGKLSVEFKAKNDDARTGVAVALYNPKNGDFVLADSYEYDLSKNWSTVRASLTGGIDGSILAFIPTRSGNVYFDDVKVWQNIKEGTYGSILANTTSTSSTTARVSNLACPEGDDVAYKVRSRGISADQTRWIYSAFSPLRYPYGNTTVTDVAVDKVAPSVNCYGLDITVDGDGNAEVYSIAGTLIAKGRCGETISLPAPGLYIVRNDTGLSTKIIVR